MYLNVLPGQVWTIQVPTKTNYITGPTIKRKFNIEPSYLKPFGIMVDLENFNLCSQFCLLTCLKYY